MDLIAPTNWDDALILEFKNLGINEVYGKLGIDVIGGGRAAHMLPDVSRKGAGSHIKKLREAGIKFNYLLNSPCLHSREFTHSGRVKIQKLVNWLVNIGVDKVTVTIPYLAQLIKDAYPSLKISVSVFAGVDCVEKALFWQNIGADEITLLQTAVNRNFNRLRLIRKNTSCRLRLLGNTGCLYLCPIIGYHATTSAHASQAAFSHKAGFAFDYCSLFCRYLRLQDPSWFIKSNWIRPEDLHIYEDIGIDSIKLVDRSCSTEQLIKICRSYSSRRFEGNLFELLPLFQGRQGLNKRNFLLKIKYFFHPLETNMFNLLKLRPLVQDLKIHLDNRKLDGFIDKFMEVDCSVTDCSDCLYCNRIAKEALSYDKGYLANLTASYKEFFSGLAKGEF